MAQKAPRTPGDRRTTYQAAGARSSRRGTIITTQGGGSTATINPGAGNRQSFPRSRPVNRRAQEERQAHEETRYARAQEREARKASDRRRRAAGAPLRAAGAVTERGAIAGRYTAKHMLTAELLIGVIIVAIRAVADYEPQADGTLKGKIGHPKDQFGPLPILAGLIVSFFLLSFLAASGGLKSKLAVIAGAVLDLGLLLNSSTEFQKVSATFGTFGTAKTPPGAWQTDATGQNVFGAPIGSVMPGGIPGGPSGGGGGGGGVPSSAPPGSIPLPSSGKCPAGYIEGGIGNSPRYCAPLNP